jgi:hypothetical protein
LLLLLLQVYRQVKLSVLASVFPQPIQYNSRKRNLQRFLNLPKLNVRLLWFPLLKYWIRQVEMGLPILGFGLYGQRWRYGMELWADWVLSLIVLPSP